MNERQCEDCGKPISICNAVTAVNVAVTRNGKDAVSAELSRADLCADPALLAEAVEVLRGMIANACAAAKIKGNKLTITCTNEEWEAHVAATNAARAFIAKLEVCK